MSNDLISRAALLGSFKNKCMEDCGYCPFAIYNPEKPEIVCGLIRKAPAIDAVEVIRCKDCKRWGTGYGGETENVKVCEYANYMVGANGYCVYGERKMDSEVKP